MSPTRRRQLLVALAAVAAAAAAGCAVNPVTGEMELMLFTERQEFAMGDEAHPDIVFTYGGEYVDPELNRYLGTIVLRLRDLSNRPGMPVDFTVVNTSIVNAFATPGHVYATRGFLAKLENEAQFAAVMGHELTHVAARHSAHAMSRDLVAGLLLEAGGTLAGDSKNGQMAVELGGAGVTLMGLSYSRQQEHQADRTGTYYMARGGWDPRQSIEMQKILGSLHTDEPTFLDRYLSTHPPTDERIADIESVIDERDLVSGGYIQGDGIFAERWTKHLAGLKTVHADYAAYDRGTQSLQKEQYADALAAADEALRKRTDQAPFHRLRGDALLGLPRPREARAAYEAALAVDPRYAAANVGLGRAWLMEGNAAEAEKQFAVAAHAWPGNLQAWHGLGLTRFQLERYADAIGPLEKVNAAVPESTAVQRMLVTCYRKTGRTIPD